MSLPKIKDLSANISDKGYEIYHRGKLIDCLEVVNPKTTHFPRSKKQIAKDANDKMVSIAMGNERIILKEISGITHRYRKN